MIKALFDYRANKAARIEDADERLVGRLESRLDKAEQLIAALEPQVCDDAAYILALSSRIF